MRISDWSSDVCSSDLGDDHGVETQRMCCQQAVEARTPERKPRIGASSRLIERQHRNHREKGVENLCRRRFAIVRSKGDFGKADGRDRNVAGRTLLHRSEEHTSELQSLMRISYAVFCLKNKNTELMHHPSHPKHQ